MQQVKNRYDDELISLANNLKDDIDQESLALSEDLASLVEIMEVFCSNFRSLSRKSREFSILRSKLEDDGIGVVCDADEQDDD